MIQIVPVVVLKHVVRASQPDVFRAWIDPLLIMRWLAPGASIMEHVETDPRVGGAFLLRRRDPDGAFHSVTGQYEEIRRGHSLHQTWTYEGPNPLLRIGETLVHIDLLSVGDRATEITLTHRRIVSADVRNAYREDWRSCFSKLQATLT
ncbi:SRPBCC domain-containing protein [Methylobacterium sp. E-045]|uniref:SRPBCC family protein n=1 Tax=Methylobacterium sp. E-045 TaxID=2836575 RepID=UPI001FBC129A|nr:SRPBCC domain-containing protein [Methylobacterium sp. E-045]MCJ2131834.1 SRPBCC domain-containing protein [Methylobacterium sp. E-045]